MSAPTRAARPALATVALVALLAACSGGGDGTSAAPPSEAPSSAAPGSDGGEGSTTTGPLDLSAGSSVVGLPDGVAAQPAEATAGAARTSDDTLIYVVTFGSSTCPLVADDTAAPAGDDAVEVTFPELGDEACTADYVPATTVVALPDEVDPEQDLTVTIGTWGDVTLPAGSQDVVWTTVSE